MVGSYWVDWVKLSMCNLNQNFLVVLLLYSNLENNFGRRGFCRKRDFVTMPFKHVRMGQKFLRYSYSLESQNQSHKATKVCVRGTWLVFPYYCSWLVVRKTNWNKFCEFSDPPVPMQPCLSRVFVSALLRFFLSGRTTSHHVRKYNDLLFGRGLVGHKQNEKFSFGLRLNFK